MSLLASLSASLSGPLSATLPATIAPAVLDTILSRLAALFVAAASPAAARQAASQTLAAYNVADEQELGLAADIIGFALHALEALGQAANPDLSLAKIIRLRGSAVSLSRESHKARRKLDQLQRARRAGASLPATETRPPMAPHHETPAAAPPARQPAIAAAPPPEARLPAAPPPGAIQPPADTSSMTPAVAPGKAKAMTWTQSYRKRQTEKHLAKKARRAQAAQVHDAAQNRQTAHHYANLYQTNPAPAPSA